MIDGVSFTPKTFDEIEAARRYSDIQLCRIFGWTPDVIEDLPSDFYEDLQTILNLEATKAKAKADMEQKKRSKNIRRR